MALSGRAAQLRRAQRNLAANSHRQSPCQTSRGIQQSDTDVFIAP